MHKKLSRIRTYLTATARKVRLVYLRSVWGMDIGEGAQISFKARLDKTNPTGIHIGEATSITFGAAILSHDFINRRHLDTYVGRHCFVGAQSIIFPGVRIGDNCIVAPASVVMKDVPANSLVAGNPARVMETNIRTGPGGYRVREESAA